MTKRRQIRPELNFEKYPIWRTSKGQKDVEVWRNIEIDTQIKLDDGRVVTAKFTLIPSGYGYLTTEDRKTYYALIALWEEAGKPQDGLVPFTLTRLFEILKRDWSQQNLESVKKSIRRLRLNATVIDVAFFDAQKGEDIELPDPVTVLIELSIRKKYRGHNVADKSSFRFHPLIINNLIGKHTRPLDLDALMGLSTDMAILTYPLVDRQLAYKDDYTVSSKKLFADLGMDSPAYKYLSDRKRTLSRAMHEMQNVPLSSGGCINAKMEPTKDKKDVNAIFRKNSLLSANDTAPELTSSPLLDELIRTGVSAKDAQTLIAEFSENSIRDHLSAMSYRIGIKYPGKYLAKAIRGNYELPADYLKTKAEQAVVQIYEDADAEFQQQARTILNSLPVKEIEQIKDEIRSLGETRQYIIDHYVIYKIIEDLKSGKR